MIDREEFTENIKVIKKNLEVIEFLNIKTLDELKEDVKNYYTLSMALFTIFNKLIEIGDDLITDLNLGTVGKYSDIPLILYDKNVISSKSKKFFIDFIRSRNDIAHEYDEMREEEIFWCFKNIENIELLIGELKKQL